MGRAPCCDKANVKKGPWSPEEDLKLKSYIEQHGTGGNWIALPQKIGLKRCGKSCRLRWLNYLRPNLKHGGFSEEEDNIICSLYINIGSRWSLIAAQLPGRTDNDIKNYWNTRLKKKLLGKQRKDHQHHHTRRASKLQEPKKPEENGALPIPNVGGGSCSATSYWPEPAWPVDDQASIKRLLKKLGGGISSVEAETPTLLAADRPHLYDTNASLTATSFHSSSYNQCLQSQVSSFSTDLDNMFACNQVKLEGFDSFYEVTGIEGDIAGLLDMPETVNWSGASSWIYPPMASTAPNHQGSIQQCSYHGQMNFGMH